MTKSDPERLSVLETKVDNLGSSQDRMETKLDSLIEKVDSNFITKDEFRAYKQSQVWQKALISIAFLLIGGLTTYFFTNIGS
jgi:hypothetical protein